ncbi:MAG: hypothetical protein OEW37_10830 [Rhodospirillaceae bacterium]|nr:hypothetical protein [Rhodospirillaceae bacterium]
MNSTKSLREQTVQILKDNQGRLPLVARETGLKHNWLATMARDEIADPGVLKCEAVVYWHRAQLARGRVA